MKKFTAILLTVLMIASLFISCENKITPVSDETVSVSFDESTSRSLTASLDEFKANKYYWAYKAVKKDNTGLVSGATNFKWIDEGNMGLTKKVAGFSQGVWEFTLYAYTEEGKLNTSYSETGLAYTGTNSSVTLVKGSDNKVTVRVNPVSRGNGYLVVDTVKITMNIKQNQALNSAQLAKFDKKVKVTNLTGTEEKYPVNGKYELPAGAYKVTVRFENKENSLEYASGSVIATVYANMTTTVQGTLDEILTNADFETEINPDVMNRNVSSDAFNTSSDNDITINKKGDAVDEKVSATVPKTVAQSILSNAITTNSIDQDNTTNEMTLSLTVDTTSTGVTEDGKSTIAYEIGMSSILTSTNVATSEVTQYSSPVTGTLDEYVVAEIKLQSGLASVSVTHNGNAMEKLSNATATPSEDNQNGAYYYDSASGLLTIKTKSFSPFEVTYKAVTYIAEINGVKYASLADAVASVKDDKETTIKLLSSVSGNGVKVLSGKNIIFDLDGYTYNIDGTTVGSTGTETNGFQLLKDSTIKFMNGKITSNKAYILIQNYSNLTLENMILDGSYSPYTNPYTLSNNNGTVLIKDSTITARSGKVAFDVCRYSSYIGPKVTVEGNSVINGNVEISSSGAKEGAKHELVVKGGTFNGSIYKLGDNPNFISNITGGTFAYDPSDYVADGYCVLQEDNTYHVTEGTIVSSKDEFVAALSGTVSNIYFGSDFFIDSTVSINRDITINGQGKTITAYYADPVIKVTGNVSVNFENLNIKFPFYTAKEGIQSVGKVNSITFKNVNITNAFKALHFSDCTNTAISINNCNLTSTYPFNVNGGNVGSFVVENTSLNGWTSFSNSTQTTYKFKNCSFGKGNDQATVKPYGNTTFEGCTFSSDYFEDLKGGIASGTVTPITINFNSCFMIDSNGAKQELTADLLKTAFNYDITSGSSSGDSTINSQYWYVNGEQLAFTNQK